MYKLKVSILTDLTLKKKKIKNSYYDQKKQSLTIVFYLYIILNG